jgi:hypothetical protein
MSDIFVDNIKHQSSQGSGTITLGASGETITTASGAKFSGITGQNYPAFEAYLSADQTVSDAAIVKAQIDTEIFDTDNCYDNSTNYRFTPTVSGKYFVYICVTGDAVNNSTCQWVFSKLYKNGSVYKEAIIQFTGNYGRMASVPISAVIDMNGTTDYLEVYGGVNTSGGANGQIHGNVANDKGTYFGAYRIGS